MNSKKFKIFISHHPNQANEIKESLAFFNSLRLKLLVAPHDTEVGKDFVKTVDKKIRLCDLFLYLCTEEANQSAFCQQELGMAKGLNKKIMLIKKSELNDDTNDNDDTTDTTDHDNNDDKASANPIGMFGHIHAQRFDGLPNLADIIFQNRIVKKFFNEELKKKSISIQNSDIPYFGKDELNDFKESAKDEFNDDEFYTTLKINHPLAKSEEDSNSILMKVAYKGQTKGKGEHSFDRLPKFFPSLSENFFSYIPDYDVSKLKSREERILHFLNDVRVLEEEKFDEIIKEEVYTKSICKSISADDIEEQREIYNKKYRQK